MKNSRIMDKSHVYAVPAIVLFCALIILSSVLTLVFSFMEWKSYSLTGNLTLEHYSRFFKDGNVILAFFNNMQYMGLTLLLEGVWGLCLAGIIWQFRKYSLIVRTIVFSPVVLPSVVIGVLWRQILATNNGLLNVLLGKLGVEPITWLGEGLSVFSVSMISGWIYSGFFMTIFYSGLSSIDDEVIEAAAIDGTNAFQTFIYIQIPLIKRYLILASIIIITGAFKGFDLFQVTLRKDPLNEGLVFPTFLVKTFFEQRNIGYGSAIATMLTLFILSLLLLLNSFSKKFQND